MHFTVHCAAAPGRTLNLMQKTKLREAGSTATVRSPTRIQEYFCADLGTNKYFFGKGGGGLASSRKTLAGKASSNCKLAAFYGSLGTFFDLPLGACKRPHGTRHAGAIPAALQASLGTAKQPWCKHAKHDAGGATTGRCAASARHCGPSLASAASAT